MKPRTNKRNYTTVYIGLILTVSFVAIFLPILWGDRTDPFWKFVYNFQTLITGAMAIFAAYITVDQMRRSDERQEKRHNELVRIALRPDKNLIAREAIHYLHQYGLMKNLYQDISQPDFKLDKTETQVLRILNTTLRHMIDLITALESGDIKIHLSPNAYGTLNFLIKIKDDFVEANNKISDLRVNYTTHEDSAFALDVTDANADGILIVCATFNHFSDIEKCMLQLVHEYEIDSPYSGK